MAASLFSLYKRATFTAAFLLTDGGWVKMTSESLLMQDNEGTFPRQLSRGE